jgi:hypothetical protein
VKRFRRSIGVVIVVCVGVRVFDVLITPALPVLAVLALLGAVYMILFQSH